MKLTASNRHNVIAIERGILNFSNLLHNGNNRMDNKIENTIGTKKSCKMLNVYITITTEIKMQQTLT
jgi:hypothetical protein